MLIPKWFKIHFNVLGRIYNGDDGFCFVQPGGWNKSPKAPSAVIVCNTYIQDGLHERQWWKDQGSSTPDTLVKVFWIQLQAPPTFPSNAGINSIYPSRTQVSGSRPRHWAKCALPFLELLMMSSPLVSLGFAMRSIIWMNVSDHRVWGSSDPALLCFFY